MAKQREISPEQLLQNLTTCHTKKLPMLHPEQEPHQVILNPLKENELISVHLVTQLKLLPDEENKNNPNFQKKFYNTVGQDGKDIE